MKVSVLIPYYNDNKYLAAAIESVLNQTMKDFELILVNHATTDNCREIAHSYNDPRIVHIDMDKNYEAGTGLITLKFLEKAKGQYIKLLCADDILYPDCLKILVDYMDTHPEKGFAFGNMEYIDKNGKSKNKDWFTDRFKFSLNNDEVACLKLYAEGVSFLPYPGSIIRREVMDDAYFDKSMIHLFDMLLWVSMLAKGYKIGYINEKVIGYRVHEEQSSTAKKAKESNQRVRFELIKYIDTFINIEDVDLLRKVFNDNIFLKKYDNFSKLDLKFIICYEFLVSNNLYYRFGAYSYIHDMLQDNETAKHLEEKFNFTVKEFRKIYSTFAYYEHGSYNEFTFKQILYMLLKKLIKLITFSKIRRINKKSECI